MSDESTNGESTDRPNRSRPAHASHLRGRRLPHPTSPADTTDTEALDFRSAGHARTEAIPLVADPAPPAPGSPAAQAAPTEPIAQLTFGQGDSASQSLSVAADIEHSALDGRTDHLGLVDYDNRTNPIPQQTISASPSRPPEGRPQPGNPPPGGVSNPPAQQQFSSLDLPQPEQTWQLGGPDHAALQQDSAQSAKSIGAQGVSRASGSPRNMEHSQASGAPQLPRSAAAPEAAGLRDSAQPGTHDAATSQDTGQPWDAKTSAHPVPASAAPPARSRRDDRPLSARERRTWLFAGIGAAVVVAVGIGVTLFTVGRPGSTSNSAASSGSLVSALTKGAPSPSAAAPSSAAPATIPNLAPLIPGYRVVQVPSRGAAFDVPENWQLDPAGSAVWGTAPNTVEIAGLAQDGKGYCPNYVRTNAFLTMSPQATPAAAATDIGARLAKIGWSTATGVTPGKAEPLTSLDGQLHGSFAETDGTFPPPAPGCAGSFAVYTFAFPGENGNFVMTIAADTGVDRAIDRPTAQRILASIRPLPDK